MEDETFYAIWEKYDVKVTFDAGRGFFGGDAQKHKTDAYKKNAENYWIDYPSNPDWVDKTKVFDCWYTTEDYSSGRIEDPWSYDFTEDTVLYAKWADAVTVTYNYNGGTSWDDRSIDSQMVAKGKEISIWNSYNKSPKANQVLSGWYDNAAMKGLKLSDYASFDEDVTLYAKWADAWKVTVDMGEGKNEYGTSEKLIEKGKEGTLYIAPAENPLSDGRYYAGVYTGPNGTGKAVSVYTEVQPQDQMSGETFWTSDSVTYAPTSDTTLYAYWAKPIEIVLDANGGTLDESGTATKTYTSLPGRELQYYSRWAERPGYMFLGWATDKEGKNIVEDATVLNKSQTLYAVWGDGYKITFDANGGHFWQNKTTEISTIAKGKPLTTYELSYVESAPADGQVFSGWYFDKACTRELNNVNSFVPTSDMTLYAGWTKGVKLTFDANGGSFYGDTEDSKVATEIQYIAKGNRADYLVSPDEAPVGKRFAGWYLDKQLTKVIDKKTTFAEDTVLYAKWVDSVRLVLDANGGWYSRDDNPSIYTITAIPGEPIEFFRYATNYDLPEKNGYFFAGWFYDKAGTNPFNPNWEEISILQDTTVYAKWIEGDSQVEISYYVGNTKVDHETVWREKDGQLPEIAVHNRIGDLWLAGNDIDYKKKGIGSDWYLDKQLTQPLTTTSNVRTPVKVYGKLLDRYTVTFHTASGRKIYDYHNLLQDNKAFLNAGTNLTNYLSTVLVAEATDDTKDLHLGWTLNNEGTQAIDPSVVISADIDLYEKTVEGYVTTFDFGEGEWDVGYWGDTSTYIVTEPGKSLSEGVSEYSSMNVEKLQSGDNFYHYGDKLFQGWYEDKALTKKVANLADYVPKEDTTLYAKWARYSETDPTPVDPDPTTPDNPTPSTPDAKQNGVIQGADGKWALYKDGKVQTSYTGIAQNGLGWWRIVEGYVDFNATGIYQNEFGWWRVENGKVNFKAQGIYQNQYGWWKCTNGKVTFKETGVFQNEYGWWRVVNSKVDFTADSIYQNKYGWWKTTNGKVTFKETGVFKNQNGLWYVNNSKVDFSKNGKVSYNGTTYTVTNGQAKAT